MKFLSKLLGKCLSRRLVCPAEIVAGERRSTCRSLNLEVAVPLVSLMNPGERGDFGQVVRTVGSSLRVRCRCFSSDLRTDGELGIVGDALRAGLLLGRAGLFRLGDRGDPADTARASSNVDIIDATSPSGTCDVRLRLR